MATPAALFTGLVKTQMAPAIRQLRIEAAMKFFSRRPDVKRMALLRRVYGGQSERAFKINRPTNKAVRDRPNISVVERSLVMTSLPRIRVLQPVNFCKASARTNARTSIRR